MTAEDLSGGADTSAVDTTITTETNQLGSTSEAAGVRSALDKAFDAVERSDDTGAGDGANVERANAGQDRNADGTFKGKADALAKDGDQQQQQQQLEQSNDKDKAVSRDAPARLDPDAKAAWGQTPDAVKTSVNRAIRELEQGVEKYRGDATIYTNVFKPFVELAVSSNVDPRAALQGYVAIDTALDQDFGAGLKMIFDRKGVDPRAWAQAVLGQKQEGGAPQPDQRDRQISALMDEVRQLRQGFGGISQTLQQQHAQGVDQSLSSYTASLSEPDRALFNELDAEIAAIISSDDSISLPEAFAKAKEQATGRYQRLFGKPPAPAQTRTPGTGGSDPRKGQLSVTGAPGNGQSVVNRAAPTSPREALDRRFAELGL